MNSTNNQSDGDSCLHVLEILNEMRRNGLESVFISGLMHNSKNTMAFVI